ncbi:hypothetical protein [Streptomyces sp. NPDC051001]|uniref:hypothetical protein n=1 Tax=Streptomyces sp. NPDC051001 TaxID=3155795 RepID=UPI003421E20D
MDDPGRYHLTLAADGRVMMQGWWADQAVAEAKCTEWIGDYGRPGASITLTDEATGETLTAWPKEP